ncbi:hypothetical protein AC792_10040, partial [Arthrobacter sp. RIT-PI-e]|uniref:hypothetical protein n=1 Tax=Arthrobacter sp. RIT-PI-e TaxID=1681197 RepID=UPI0006A008A6
MSTDDAGTSPAGEGRRSSSQGPEAAVPAPSQGPPSYRTVGTDGGGASVSGRAAGDRPQRGPGRLVALLGAVVGGLVAGVFGTLLHGHLVYA